MLHFSKWKMISILFAVFLGVLFALPNVLPQSTLDAIPEWLPRKQVALGLDLQGGVHLQVQVQREDIVKERLENLVSDVRAMMRDREKGPLGYSGIRASGDTVTVRLLKPDDAAATTVPPGHMQKLYTARPFLA